MWSTLRSRSQTLTSSILSQRPPWKKDLSRTFSSSLTPNGDGKTEILKLEEVEKVLNDVKADDVRVFSVGNLCDYTDFMVFATGRSAWHVRNIAQALVYKAKEKQRGAPRMLLPSVEGQESGKWIVIDSGSVMVHALDENARAYYDLESRWTMERPPAESKQDLDNAMVKVRRKNNSKKRRTIDA